MLVLKNPSTDLIRLIEIQKSDLANLRIWKNHNKFSFFYQEDITQEEQKKWYEDFCNRDNDFMFIVEEKKKTFVPIGCMGFRVKNGEIDLYNIIRGEKSDKKEASMKNAMVLMLNYIFDEYNYTVKCDVLKNNPAVEWYKSCGFAISEDLGYYVMEIKRENVPKLDIMVEED